MNYIAVRAQIWGMISFASTFAQCIFLQARLCNIQSNIHLRAAKVIPN